MPRCSQLGPGQEQARTAWRAGHVYVIGKHSGSGELVSSWLPATESGIKKWAAAQSDAAGWHRSAENDEQQAARCEDEASELEDAAARLLLDDGYIRNGTYCALHHDAVAARYDACAAEQDQEAASAADELTRLKALADAAQERHYAAQERNKADNARALAKNLRAKAADYRTRAGAHQANAETHRGNLARSTAWENREIESITATAAEWETLPLIVLAGLR